MKAKLKGNSTKEKNDFMVKKIVEELDTIEQLLDLFRSQLLSYRILHDKEDSFFDFTICCANLERAQADMNAAAGHFCKYAEYIKKQ